MGGAGHERARNLPPRACWRIEAMVIGLLAALGRVALFAEPRDHALLQCRLIIPDD